VYIIDGTLSIKGATLTIEPGTVVKFKDGAQIEVGYNTQNSTLIANGTAAEPITFTSFSSTPASGDWDYIYFGEGATSNCSLSYCTILYGGGYNSDHGAIHLYDSKISIDHCIIKNTKYYGVSLNRDAEFKNFNNNTIENTGSYAINIYPNAVHTIGTYNNISASTTKGIKVNGGTFSLNEETWLEQSCPYVIDGALSIQSSSGATLKIDAGNTILFTDGSQIEVAYNSGNFGTLIANGTENKPILFSSTSTTPEAGDWDAILCYSGTTPSTSFQYCTFEYGGNYSSSYGMVHLSDCKASFINCTFRHSKYDALRLSDDAEFVSFENNTFENIIASNYPVSLYPNAAATIGTGNTFNTNLGVRIFGGTYTLANATWRKLNIPYYIDGTAEIQSTSGATLTIEPGTTIKFTQGSQIEVAYNSGKYGKIIAQGTASEPIIFTSAAPDGAQSNGDWDAILLYEGTMSGTIFDNCKILYGGGYTSSYGQIHISNSGSNVTVSNCEIAYSGAWGISINSASPNITGINYHDNTEGDVTNW